MNGSAYTRKKQCKETVNFEERTGTCFARKDNLMFFVKSSFTPIFQKYFYIASGILSPLASCDLSNNGASFEMSC